LADLGVMKQAGVKHLKHAQAACPCVIGTKQSLHLLINKINWFF